MQISWIGCRWYESLNFKRIVSCIGRKEDLISSLVRYDDEMTTTQTTTKDSNYRSESLAAERVLSSEELKELATIADEMKHLRRQWLLQIPRQQQGAFFHQGYGSSATVRNS